MANPSDYPAHGKVTAIRDGIVVFNPGNTNYELQLLSNGGAYTGPTNVPIDALIRVTARKLWTVPSGGNFIAPIFGPPRTIQGRVRYASDTELVVHAGVPILVALPSEDSAIDLTNGAIALNTMVNVVALPGATFELLPQPAGSAAR